MSAHLSDTRDPPVWIRRANGGVASVGGGMHACACNARPRFSLLRLAPLLLIVIVCSRDEGKELAN